MIGDLKVGDDARRNWRTINEISAQLNRLDLPNQSRDAALAGQRQRPRDIVGGSNCYHVKERIEDVLRCRSWDGSTEGADDVYIAVNRNSRYITNLPSETLAGVVHDYTAGTDLDSFNLVRVSDNGTDTEDQVVSPLYYLNCEIDAVATSYSGVTFDDTVNPPYDLKVIETSARCWAKIVATV